MVWVDANSPKVAALNNQSSSPKVVTLNHKMVVPRMAGTHNQPKMEKTLPIGAEATSPIAVVVVDNSIATDHSRVVLWEALWVAL